MVDVAIESEYRTMLRRFVRRTFKTHFVERIDPTLPVQKHACINYNWQYRPIGCIETATWWCSYSAKRQILHVCHLMSSVLWSLGSASCLRVLWKKLETLNYF